MKTETDFREFLLTFDNLLRVRKIGSSGKSWVALGELREGKTVKEVRIRLEDSDVDAELAHENGTIWLKVKEKTEANSRSVPVLTIPKTNIILLFLTVITTLIAGSMLGGGNPLSNLSDIWIGFHYSLALLLILGSHEFGHYIFARKHNIDATLPYFIPAPPFLLLIGTFGAFIRLKSPIYHRRALLEIGASGPIAGFVVSFLVIIVGYSLIPDQEAVFAHIGRIHHLMGIDSETTAVMEFSMGTSVLFSGLGSLFNIVIPMDEIYHFPLIFAGWIGFLVTMLNLLPIGQLDGGHIAFAILGKKHNRMAKWVFLLLIPLGIFVSIQWLIWAVIILALMRSWKHPPIFDVGSDITRRDKLIGLACLIILFSCFIPIPIR